MRTTDLRDLMKTVETMRAERYPDLDAGFLEAVVQAEEESPEDDGEAMRSIQAALNALLEREGRS
jgi:hypothetical protein